MNVQFTRGTLCAASLFLAAGCSGGGGGGGGAANLSGTWQYTSGPSLLDIGESFGGVATADANLEFIQLEANGSGKGFASAPLGQIGCGNLIFSTLDENIVRLDFPEGNINRTFRYERSGANLSLFDEFGAATVFTSVAAVPAASQCSEATEVTRAVLATGAGSNTSLTTDGTNLYYNDGSTGVISIAIATLAPSGPPITTLGSYDVPFGMQGADFWGHCNCGANAIAQRSTVAGAMVDLVDTDADLAHPVTIRAGAFDGTKLWIAGNNQVAFRYELLRINTAGEPDLLELAAPLGFYPRGLSISAGTFWSVGGVLGPALVSIDPVTGSVTRTVELPPDVYYQGVVVVGQEAYLLGDTVSNYGPVMLHVTIPAS